MIPLFERFPRLAERIPYIPLGEWPTPLGAIAGKAVGLPTVYVKRDDLTGTIYGGNKVRKLEFLLAEAKRRGAKEVITFGFAGSNHATATAVYARKAGLRSISMLLPQAISRSLRRNLLLSARSDATLKHFPNAKSATIGTLVTALARRIGTGAFPMIIPAGGSSPLGICGFVNAALELEQQVQSGALPEPDWIYVAVGSMGSVVGLSLGLQLTALRTRIMAVRVIYPAMANPARMTKLARQTARFLHGHDASVPLLSWDAERVQWRNEFFGSDYAVFTEAGTEAAKWFREETGLNLDGTYSAKALAALVHDGRAGKLEGLRPLFWNTYNSKPVFDGVEQDDYRTLPAAFHSYFEGDVQPLDG